MSTSVSLRSRIIRASTWTFGGHAAAQILRLLSNLILTRLLVPEMFGVMVIANVIMFGLALLSDIGLNQSIVQSGRGNDPAFLNTAWTLQVIRGGLIWLSALLIGVLLHLLAASGLLPLASTYADPVLPYIVGALSFGALINGFASTRLPMASRTLALGRMTLMDILCQLAGITLMICWATVDRSIWALVAGALFSNLLRVALSHMMLPGPGNYLHWDNSSYKEIFGYGKWVFLTSILGFAASNGDRLLLGALVSPATMGLYSIAFFLVNALQELLSKLAASVAFPALSEVARERPGAMKAVYYKFRLPLDIAALFFSGLIFSAGHLIIEILYDQRYEMAGAMIEVLCIGLFEARFVLAGQCFMAMGMPKLLAPIILIRLIAVFVLLPIIFHFWGFHGALWVAGGSALFTLPLIIFLKIRHGLFSLKHELSVLPLLAVGYGLGEIFNKAAFLTEVIK